MQRVLPVSARTHAGGALDVQFVQPEPWSYATRNVDTSYWCNGPAAVRVILGCMCLPMVGAVALLVLTMFGVLTIPVLHGF